MHVQTTAITAAIVEGEELGPQREITVFTLPGFGTLLKGTLAAQRKCPSQHHFSIFGPDQLPTDGSTAAPGRSGEVRNGIIPSLLLYSEQL